MTVAAYIGGCLALVALVLSVGVAASRTRAVVLPSWSGPPARLAEIVLGLSFVTVLLELLGSVGLLRPLAVTVVVPGIATVIAARARPRDSTHARPRDSRLRPEVLWGLALLGAVSMQWLAHARPVVEGGFRDMDSLRYHGPFVARWIQQHGLLHLQHTSSELQETFFPGTSELLSTYGVLAFGRDVLAPVFNFGWFAIGGLAAWCAATSGRGRAAAIAAFAAIWSTPLLSSIEPGSAKNDIAAAALVLATAALVVRALDGDVEERGRVLVIAALCGGLAVGTKLDTLVAIGVLLVGAALTSPRRSRVALSLAGCAATTGGFWYVRNLLATGNPLPWLRHLGPVDLPGPDMSVAAKSGWSVMHYVGDARFWTTTVPRDLLSSFGPLWPVLLVGGAVLAVGAVLSRGSSPSRRLVAVACLASGAVYLVTPYSAGGPDGNPTLFALDLRFLAPALVLATALVRTRPQARAILIASTGVVLINQVAGHGRWPGPGTIVLSIGVAIAGVIAIGIVVVRVMPVRIRVAGVGLAIALSAVVGWSVSADMLSDRYANVQSGLTAAFAMFRGTHDLRIAVGGFADDYPLFGTDLSNRVQFIGVDLAHGGYRPARTCTEWRAAIDAGRYQYVVVSRSPVARQRLPIEATWTATDPEFRLVLERGVTRVFRRVGTDVSEACPQVVALERPSRS